MKVKTLTAITASISAAAAQTFQRLGTCPTLGCILPPDQQDFLPGQYFDLRLEIHAPVNGSEAFNNGVPDENFTVTISKDGDDAKSIASYFSVDEPKLETWKFSWYEDLFAKNADKKSIVNVASKVYRHIALYEPGEYKVTLTYYNGTTTEASWVVRDLAQEKKAKNVILFIGDGMTTNMITAARLIGHKSINGKYQSTLAMDKFPILGHQMTHSLDSFITDSANSASALYTGHKSTVNALGVYADSSSDLFDDPKVETIIELFMRVWGGVWGAVSTALLADATPIALSGHSRLRSQYGPLIDMALNGVTNYTWTANNGPEVYLGGGAEQFYPGAGSYQGKDYYAEFAKKGYQVVLNNTALSSASVEEKLLGVFCQSNLPVWLDRNILTHNLANFKNDPTGTSDPALDLPGLKEMTLKAVEVLSARSSDAGFFLMSEGASIDKQMHALDYHRALGDLLELDDTINATIALLEEMGILDETLVLVTADHGHGFDVWGSADTSYLAAQKNDRDKRDAIGTYGNSGLSQYQVVNASISYSTGANFPVNWDPRYALAQGFGANPDRREDYRLNQSPRKVAATTDGHSDHDHYVNAKDAPNGFIINGTLPVDADQGVHSLTDVPIFAMGPCQNLFTGTFSNIDVFYKMAECLGLGQPSPNATIPHCSKARKF